jgi:hypothetical protein
MSQYRLFGSATIGLAILVDPAFAGTPAVPVWLYDFGSITLAL